MMDFAQPKVISQPQDKEKISTKEKTGARAITISPASIIAIITFSLVIYILGYQNMAIHILKHTINQQKSQLNSLIVEKQDLLKKQKALLNPADIINYGNLKVATPNNVKILN